MNSEALEHDAAAQPAKSRARVDSEMYRMALAADRRGALAAILAALFAATALQHRGAARAVWAWAGVCTVLAL